MTDPRAPEPTAAEPRPIAGGVRFEEGDFHALSEGLERDRQYDDRRLVTRRKLLALGKEAARRAARDAGLGLDVRSSLHHPHAFNGMRVRRIWTYLTRTRAEKRRLRSVLGPELGKDLDASYRNAYLCIACEAERLEVSFRIHRDAWYDGQNLVRRVGAEGLDGLLERLNALPGTFLRLADWKGEWRCGELGRDALEEFFRYYTPGEHALAVERSWPAPPGRREAALGEGVAEVLVEEVLRLVEVYRYAAWSAASSFLFA